MTVATWYVLDGDRVLVNMDATGSGSNTSPDSARSRSRCWTKPVVHPRQPARQRPGRRRRRRAPRHRPVSKHYTGIRAYPNRESPRCSGRIEVDRWHGWGKARTAEARPQRRRPTSLRSSERPRRCNRRWTAPIVATSPGLRRAVSESASVTTRTSPSAPERRFDVAGASSYLRRVLQHRDACQPDDVRRRAGPVLGEGEEAAADTATVRGSDAPRRSPAAGGRRRGRARRTRSPGPPRRRPRRRRRAIRWA